MPEMLTGCEITALTMLWKYYGFDVDKETMAYQYCFSRFLLRLGWFVVWGGYGKNFVGDPGGTGYVCGTTSIINAANDFFEELRSDYTATVINDGSRQNLYNLLEQEIPVLVWVTIGMAPRSEIRGWYTEEGAFMDWAENDHCAVLIGYNDTSVIIADPILGEYSCDKEAFETVFASRGNGCVILQNNK